MSLRHPQRKRARRKRNKPDLQAFGHALAAIARGTKALEDVFAELFGDCEIGRFWVRDALEMCTHARVEDETLADESQRDTHHPVARRIARLFVRMCARTERAGSDLRVKGRSAFWGKQHRRIPLDDLEAAMREEDRLQRLERRGLPAVPKKKLETFRREYVPARQQGGIAAELERSARTVGRYARILRRAGFWGSKQPRASAPDAIVPKGGDYAYAQWTMLRPPPPRLMQALRVLWGEPEPKASRPKPPPTAPSSRPEPPRARDVRLRGPPAPAPLVELLSDFLTPPTEA